MRRLNYNHINKDNSVDINISPLIDIVFLLLIFFIVTTSFVDETGIEVKRPHAAAAKQIDKNSIMIGISSSGEIYYAGHKIDLNSVRSIVSQQLRIKTVPVIVIPDKTTKSGILVDVIDECKLAGAPAVSIATDKE